MKLTLAKVLARKYQQVVLYLTLPAVSQTVWTQIRPDIIRPDKMPRLIWIQTF